MNLQPLSHRIILKALEEQKVTQSGIVLPDNASQKPTRGEVVAVGPGKRADSGQVIPMTLKVGDVVLFKKYGPDEVEVDGVTYLIGDEDDVLAIITK